ncbi:potassium channel subfamily K member 4 isoform X1 [Xenopus laevis]|uniref:Potassium channel subfamily K member 4 n=1 Tax=Xenopus laevis TaxID=8355 RepID=A0A8J1MXA4_XENLA|nr:potassium channel subfamily K member 4 isoform X1 [Xenopus laevis]
MILYIFLCVALPVQNLWQISRERTQSIPLSADLQRKKSGTEINLHRQMSCHTPLGPLPGGLFYPLSYSSQDSILLGDQVEAEETTDSAHDKINVMKKKTVLALFGFVLGYLVTGAVVFQMLEKPFEALKQGELSKHRILFLNEHTCLQEDRLDEFIEQVKEAIGYGVDPSANATNVTTRWDIGSCFFFAGTVITTIGFGTNAPKTEGGQIFCIFYALVGIPLFGILLAGVGDHLGSSLRKGIGKVEVLFLKWHVSPTLVRVISAVLFILIGCLLFVFIPMLIFQKIESWTFLESIYFVVITLTTIGFGDYVAGDGAGNEHTWYKPLVWFWILLGLAYFASILTMIGNWLRALTRKTRAEMGGLTAHAANWTASMTAEMKLPHRGMSLNFQERLQKQKGSMEAPGLQQIDVEQDEEEQKEESEEEDKDPPHILPPSPPVIKLTSPVSPSMKTNDEETKVLEWGKNMAFIDESSDSQSEKGEREKGVERGGKGRTPRGKRKRRGLKGDSHPVPRNRDKGESG